MNQVLMYLAKQILTTLFNTLVKSAKKIRKTKKKLDRREAIKRAKNDDDFIDNVSDDHIM